MRIAQVAPLFESVPPRLYGGTERVVSYLTEELVREGHDITLFASGDSRTAARLVPVWDTALRLDERSPEPTSLHVVMIEEVFRRATEFDVIHFHIDALQLPLASRSGVPFLTTKHGRLDMPGLRQLYAEFADAPLVSVSDDQRSPLPGANWVATVHHGLPSQLYSPGKGGGHLAFLGRISPEKGVDRAIEIARRSGMPLKIAAKIDRVDRDYFITQIRPLMHGPDIEFLGEVTDEDKGAFLGGAKALIFPIDWPEPFGLVIIEALACGTPVIAFRRGSVPEILEDGVTGFVVDSVEEAVQRVAQLPQLDRRRCRAEFDHRFTARRMAQDYCAVYARLMENWR